MSDLYFSEIRGAMTQFLPVTDEIIKKLSDGKMDYNKLRGELSKLGLSIDKVVCDPTRKYENVYYADYEKGFYLSIILTDEYLQELANRDLKSDSQEVNYLLATKQYREYYIYSMPLPMIIYDFNRRVWELPKDQVYKIWHENYKRLDYANGLWEKKVLDHVFANASECEKPVPGKNGKVTVFRGVGEKSLPPEKAISWTTHPTSALYFATHYRGDSKIIAAKIDSRNIVAYYGSNYEENEVIVRPGTVSDIRDLGMISISPKTFIKLIIKGAMEFVMYGRQVQQLGYKPEGLYGYHGASHILRVLLLSLVYFYNSGDKLGRSGKKILVYFSLMHDLGRTNDHEDECHGDASIAIIKKQGLSIDGINLSETEQQIADLIIKNHCRDDKVGLAAIRAHTDLTRQEKKFARKLYRICKDMDGLDRVRFYGFDFRMLRTRYAAKLPIFATQMVKEDMIKFMDTVYEKWAPTL